MSSPARTVPGEGVRRDARRDELLFVDIVEGLVFRERITESGGLSPVRRYRVGQHVGAITPIDGDEGFLLATGRGFGLLALDGTLRMLAEPAPPGTRMNDGACDPHGRFWAGTLAYDFAPGAGALYCLERDGTVRTVLEGLTISNDIGWSPDARTLYPADSGTRDVFACDVSLDDARIGGRRRFIRLREDEGAPDGLTVDADGDVRVAVYGGAQVRLYAPKGILRDTYRFSAPQTTCCAFAGPGMSRLYVTTATEHYTDEQRRAEPLAGAMFHVETNAAGIPARPFRPVGDWWRR